MSVKTDEIAALEEELTMLNTTIENILKGGQRFQKGGRTGFSVDQAKLPELYKTRREVKAKLATWGVYSGH